MLVVSLKVTQNQTRAQNLVFHNLSSFFCVMDGYYRCENKMLHIPVILFLSLSQVMQSITEDKSL